jgi:dihydropyrimidinase
MTVDLVVKDVRAVLPTGVRHVDIEVIGGDITAIKPVGKGGPAKQIVDGGGREAFPGVIDPHVHFRAYPNMGVPGDGFTEMTECAARGGMTSVIAFITAPKEVVGREAVEPATKASGRVPVDFGVHHVLWPREENLAALNELAAVGVRTFKMFMAYPERGFMFDGRAALDGMGRVAGVGGLLLVHCEEGNAIRWADDALRSSKGASAGILDYYAARPENLEATAVELVGLWGRMVGCPLYLVHISTAGGSDAGRRLMASGTAVTLETCPQYLVTDSSRLEQLGALAKFAPVLRPPHHGQALWDAIGAGAITVIGSDHAGHKGSEKQRIAGERGILDVPYGVPGVETLFPLMYTAGVVSGRLRHEQLAEITSTNAAKRFGWYPKKGAIREGASADLVLIDQTTERPVEAKSMQSLAGFSLYEGMRLRGWPSTTILRGEITFDGKHVASARGTFQATHPAGRLAEMIQA